MRHSRTFSLYIFVGALALFALPWVAATEEKFTDFRGKSSYSSTDMEKALFPESAMPRVRGVEPSVQKSLSQSQPPAVASTPTKAAVALNVSFATNSDKILPQYYDDLDKLGEMLARRPNAVIQIEGHTDSRGSDTLNLSLSEKRAESIKRYLTQKFSLAPDHIMAKGFGSSQPRESNDTPQGRSANRRVEVVNLGQK
jgi:OOP family OmpA-OmpF porin